MTNEVRTVEVFAQHFEKYRAEIMRELAIANSCPEYSKDIIIVVHDQLPYLKACIESIQANTNNYHLYIWDNASQPDTQEYLDSLMLRNPGTVDVMRSEENIGFILPNNQLASWGTGEYIILLNSDTKVFEGWDKGMIGCLNNDPEIAQVGYLGGVLNEDGRGVGWGFGFKLDYVPGWCFCISRETYSEFGLFNEKDLTFAYCEDADFSLRLQEAGKKVYAMHLMLVHHYENKTIKVVRDKGEIDVVKTFEQNHEYMRRRWKDYLLTKRVAGKEPKHELVDY
jgi:GT2 family glycosyltransferase